MGAVKNRDPRIYAVSQTLMFIGFCEFWDAEAALLFEASWPLIRSSNEGRHAINFCDVDTSNFYFNVATRCVKSCDKNAQHRFQYLHFLCRPTQLDDESVIRFRES